MTQPVSVQPDRTQTIAAQSGAAVRLTPSQHAAVTSRAPHTLVSAAAGSGKTSVLTQRIVALVCGAGLDETYDPNAPQVNPAQMTDIDGILVMTFTRSAAAEMRRRIIERLNEAAAGVSRTDPDAARRLYDQAERAAGADISTVHSFCQHLLADYYERAGIAPRTTVLSETQQAQVMAETLQQLFADIYAADTEEGNPEWIGLKQDLISLLHKHTRNGDDTAIAENVLRTYRKMMGLPDWDAWLDLSTAPERMPVIFDAWRASWVEKLELAGTYLSDAMSILGTTPDLSEKERDKHLQANHDVQELLVDAVRLLRKSDDVWQARALFPDRTSLTEFTPTKARPEKPTGDLAAIASYNRRVKDILKQMGDECADDRETATEKIRAAHEDARIMAALVREFEKRYSQRKRALNKIDFDDMEHMALKVLQSLAEDGEPLKKHYTHVFVDEYQDTNPVQEEILRTLQKIETNAHVFMVGDLKQSIYAFRAADSRIFRDKDKELSDSQADQAIYMNDNFRSAPVVVEAVNAIMGCVMTEKLGGVDYDEHQALRCGSAERCGGKAQILMAAATDAGSASESGEAGSGTDEISPEARMIAQKVEELVAAGIPYGDPAESPYSKIAVLSRTRSSKAYLDLPAAFDARGIPYWLDEDKYQTFTELDLFLNLLELTVNNRRDVPLVSVLRSYMYDMDEVDFARISDWYYKQKAVEDALERGDGNDVAALLDDGAAAEQLRSRQLVARAATLQAPFFQQVGAFHSAMRSEDASPTRDERSTLEKLERFYADLEKLRVRGTDMALGKFVEEVASHYDFGGYLLTRPNGVNRRRAFDGLLQAIQDQAQVSGNSLYRVLDAVRKNRRNKPPTAMADSVRIMSMHKSKGLEYPIVFVADLNHGFNTQDSKKTPLLDTDYGIVMSYVDEEEHARTGTLESFVTRQHIADASMSEELRALYVAMTRARDELYLCGTADPAKGDPQRWELLPGQYSAAHSMLDWVMGACAQLQAENRLPAGLYDSDASWYQASAGKEERQEAQDRFDAEREDALELVEKNEAEAPQELLSLPEKKRVPAVLTVSKVVTAQRGGVDHSWYRTRATREVSTAEPDTPDTLSGAERGTALHEALQYAVRENRDRLRTAPGTPVQLLDGQEAVCQMCHEHLISQEVASELAASASAIDAFLDHELYERVKRSPRVLVEQPFTLLMSQKDEKGHDSAQKIRLQGRIDLAFEEEDGWVLVDYKSDRLASASDLRALYGHQMGYYKKALETALGGSSGKKVRECYLFSLAMKEPIRLRPQDLAVPEYLEG